MARVYVIRDRTTGVVTGPYASVEPGSGQERSETVGSTVMNNVCYTCPWCRALVDEVENGLEHRCDESAADSEPLG